MRRLASLEPERNESTKRSGGYKIKARTHMYKGVLDIQLSKILNPIEGHSLRHFEHKVATNLAAELDF